jgi:mannosyltransferase OCH1-like enzyme
MKLWTEENIPPLSNGDLLQKCSCLGQRSDIVRYEILLREGGVYIDTDMECLRSIEPLIRGGKFFALRRDPRIENRETHSTAIFGAAQQHPIMADMVKGLRQKLRPESWTSIGPPFLSAVLGNHKTEFIDLPDWISFDLNDGRRSLDTRPPRRAYITNHHSSKWFPPSTERI